MKNNGVIQFLMRHYLPIKVFIFRSYYIMIQKIRYALFRKLKNIPDNVNVIVSMTSIPSRFEDLPLVLESLTNQSYSDYKIILWISEEFKNHPIWNNNLIKYYQQKGVEVRFCRDIRSHTKYYYAFKEYKDKIIVLADDDILYPRYWLKKLMRSYYKHPDCIHCYRARLINDDFTNYNSWNHLSNGYKGPSKFLFPEAVMGVLYPPNCLPDETLNLDRILKLTPYADDIWLKTMSLLKKIEVLKVNKNSAKFIPVTAQQTEALHRKNVAGKMNDKQLENVDRVYNISHYLYM